MAGRAQDQSPDGRERAGPQDTEAAADPRPGDPVERDIAEREKAQAEIAAGDVADDLADFA